MRTARSGVARHDSLLLKELLDGVEGTVIKVNCDTIEKQDSFIIICRERVLCTKQLDSTY